MKANKRTIGKQAKNPGKAKFVMFHGANARHVAALAIAQGIGNIVHASGEMDNARALRQAAMIEMQTIVRQLIDSGITIEQRASKGTLAAEVLDLLRGPGFELTGRTPDNYLSAVRRAVNGYDEVDAKGKKHVSHNFTLNLSRDRGKGKGGAAKLIEKSDSSYSINARADTPVAKLVDALKQFGAWIKSTHDDEASLQLAAYLVDVDDVAAGTK